MRISARTRPSAPHRPQAACRRRPTRCPSVAVYRVNTIKRRESGAVDMRTLAGGRQRGFIVQQLLCGIGVHAQALRHRPGCRRGGRPPPTSGLQWIQTAAGGRRGPGWEARRWRRCAQVAASTSRAALTSSASQTLRMAIGIVRTASRAEAPPLPQPARRGAPDRPVAADAKAFAMQPWRFPLPPSSRADV